MWKRRKLLFNNEEEESVKKICSFREKETKKNVNRKSVGGKKGDQKRGRMWNDGRKEE